jgi:sulfopyruvate decarboxylase subunit alpha
MPAPVAETMLRALIEQRFRLATGVPCSLLRGLFAQLEDPDSTARQAGLRYLAAPREDSALGVASGAAVAGERAVVLLQNSGLGYCLNVLTSFNLIYQVPVLLIVSWRGHDDTDAVEHDVIGRQLLPLLELFELPHQLLDPDDPAGSVHAAVAKMDRARRCAALLVTEPV